MHRLQAFLSFLIPAIHVSAAKNCPPGYMPIPGAQPGGIGCEAFACFEGEKTYYDKSTGKNACCDENLLVILDEKTREGLCCPTGQVVKDGVCTISQPPCGACTPGPCKGRCTETPVCGDDKCLGLKYGKCYFITFPDGKQLQRERETLMYKKDPGDVLLPIERQTALIGDIPFKVCKSTSDCGSQSGCVTPQDPFFLQDQIGDTHDPTGKPGFNKPLLAGNHQSFTPDPNMAAQFQGRTSCSHGECAIQIYGGLDNPGAWVPACPMPDPGLTIYPNQKVALRMHFIEVPCDGDYGKFWKETGADKLCT